jgi:hypothetical protein
MCVQGTWSYENRRFVFFIIFFQIFRDTERRVSSSVEVDLNLQVL